MTKDERGQRPGHHDLGRTITERFRAWLMSTPVLSLVTCAHCTMTQMLSRYLGTEVKKTLPCRGCGADIATVARGRDGEAWIDLIDASVARYPTSPYQVTPAAADRSW